MLNEMRKLVLVAVVIGAAMEPAQVRGIPNSYERPGGGGGDPIADEHLAAAKAHYESYIIRDEAPHTDLNELQFHKMGQRMLEFHFRPSEPAAIDEYVGIMRGILRVAEEHPGHCASDNASFWAWKALVSPLNRGTLLKTLLASDDGRSLIKQMKEAVGWNHNGERVTDDEKHVIEEIEKALATGPSWADPIANAPIGGDPDERSEKIRVTLAELDRFTLDVIDRKIEQARDATREAARAALNDQKLDANWSPNQYGFEFNIELEAQVPTSLPDVKALGAGKHKALLLRIDDAKDGRPVYELCIRDEGRGGVSAVPVKGGVLVRGLFVYAFDPAKPGEMSRLLVTLLTGAQVEKMEFATRLAKWADDENYDKVIEAGGALAKTLSYGTAAGLSVASTVVGAYDDIPEEIRRSGWSFLPDGHARLLDRFDSLAAAGMNTWSRQAAQAAKAVRNNADESRQLGEALLVALRYAPELRDCLTKVKGELGGFGQLEGKLPLGPVNALGGGLEGTVALGGEYRARPDVMAGATVSGSYKVNVLVAEQTVETVAAAELKMFVKNAANGDTAVESVELLTFLGGEVAVGKILHGCTGGSTQVTRKIRLKPDMTAERLKNVFCAKLATQDASEQDAMTRFLVEIAADYTEESLTTIGVGASVKLDFPVMKIRIDGRYVEKQGVHGANNGDSSVDLND